MNFHRIFIVSSLNKIVEINQNEDLRAEWFPLADEKYDPNTGQSTAEKYSIGKDGSEMNPVRKVVHSKFPLKFSEGSSLFDRQLVYSEMNVPTYLLPTRASGFFFFFFE
jgi:hypothetical protein